MGTAIEDVSEWEQKVEDLQDAFQKISEVIKVSAFSLCLWQLNKDIILGGDGTVSALQGGGLQEHHRCLPGGHHQDPAGHGQSLGGFLGWDKTYHVIFVVYWNKWPILVYCLLTINNNKHGWVLGIHSRFNQIISLHSLY